MNYRVAQIFAPKDMGTDGTEPIDIKTKDPISRIMVCFRAQNGSNDMDDHPAANITKIELVDGSDKLYSLTGKEGQALNFFNRKRKPHTYIDNHDDHWETAVIGLDFGRYLYDPELALIPTNFENLQLKVSYDEDVCELDADNNYLEAYAFLFDEMPVSPIGFLSAREIKSFALSADTYEYTNVPTDRVLRGLFVNTIKNGYTWTTHIAECRLSEEGDKRIPIDMDENRLLYLLLEEYGYIMEHAYLDGVDSEDGCYVMGTDLGHAVGSSYGDDQDITMWTKDGQQMGYFMASTSYSGKFLILSAIPHGSMPLLYHDMQRIENWYDVTKLESLELRVKGGSSVASGTTAEVVVEQLRRY